MSATMTTTTVVKGAEEGGNVLTRLAWYYQMLILLGLVALLIFATDALFFKDTRSQTEDIRKQSEDLKNKNAQASIILQNLPAVEQTIKEKHDEIDRLRDLLPDQVEISKVFENIKDLVREQRLELKTFEHQKAVPADLYTAQPIKVEVTGQYDGLGNFFSRLGFYGRIVSVTDVEIKQAEDNAQASGRSINSTFVVTAYYIAPENLVKLTSQTPPAPAAPGAPPPKPAR